MLSGCDAVITKRSRNLVQSQIRTEEIPDLEVIQILNYLADRGVGLIVIEHPRMKKGGGGKIDRDRSICLCYPDYQYNIITIFLTTNSLKVILIQPGFNI